MVIVLLYRVTFQASYKGSHFELGITTDMSMRNTIPEPTNQTKVSLARPIRSKTKTNRDLLARVFPRFARATCICFKL